MDSHDPLNSPSLTPTEVLAVEIQSLKAHIQLMDEALSFSIARTRRLESALKVLLFDLDRLGDVESLRSRSSVEDARQLSAESPAPIPVPPIPESL